MSVTPSLSESIEISTIKLNLNGIAVELKIEEARKLWNQLDGLFGAKQAPWVIPVPYPTYPQPIWVHEPTITLPYFGDNPNQWRVTCNAYTGNTLELR